MANLDVIPSYQFQENEIITADKLNLMATPVVNLALETPVNDQNYWRNGNFYSGFWTNPAGVSCPVGVETINADYWSVNPKGAAVNSLRSTDVPDLYSLFSLQVVGAANVTDVSVGQSISGDLSATLRRPCTMSGFIENNSGGNVSPVFEIWTADTFNGFNTVTLQQTANLQTCPTGAWTFVSVTEDLTNIPNAANGLLLKIRLPSGALSSSSRTMNFSRLKFQIGEIATEFADDTSLFIETPSVDSTMLQDGCLARSSLYVTNPGVIPKGAFAPGVIQSADIGAAQVMAVNLDPGTPGDPTATPPVPERDSAVVGCLGYSPVNKAGDTGLGKLEHDVDTLWNSSAPTAGGVVIAESSANATNANYAPTIGFNRPGSNSRAIGLATTGRFNVIDGAGTAGYLLDSVFKVDTNSYQDGSITLQKLAQSLISIVIPAGMVRMYAGPSPPAGWLICDGTAYAQSSFPGLYAAIGTYWGSGSGAQQFNVPDFRGRAPIGYVNAAVGGITGRAFASRGGEESHVLSPGEVANHTHPITDQQHVHAASDSGHTHTDAGHTHTVPISTFNGLFQGGGNANFVTNNNTTSSVGRAAIQTGFANITTDYRYTGINTTQGMAGTPGNGAHNTMMPFSVLYFIIKT